MTFDRQLAIQCAKSIACLYDGLVQPNVMCRETDTEALIEEHHDGRWAIIFPGTSSRADWITDFKFRREPFFGGTPDSGLWTPTVHRGFRAAHESVERQIRERIPPLSEIIIAGHSLGGALATLAAYSLHGYFRVRAVYTFGSPRVGNGSFVRSYNEYLGDVTARVVNMRDPVPYTPPWLFGNRHTCTEVYLNDTRWAEFDRSLVAIARDRTADVLEKIQDDPKKQLISISAHYISSYIRKLEALA